MTLPGEPLLQRLQFYLTAPFACGYLEGRSAITDGHPHHLIDTKLYNHLINYGFR